LKRGFEEDYGGTMPVGLPGTSYFLGIPYTPVKRLMQEGLPVALATDFNPGSSPIASLQLVWALACTQMKMLPIEAFHAITCNAARALRLEHRVGSLAVGMRADFLVTNTLNAVKAIPYFAGQNHIAEVYVNGVLFK
jgi:imidazolonepropionase